MIHELRLRFDVDESGANTTRLSLCNDTERAMAHHFREPERRRPLLLPADMRDWLPQGAIVHLIVDAVAMRDLSDLEAGCRVGPGGAAACGGRGRPAGARLARSPRPRAGRARAGAS